MASIGNDANVLKYKLAVADLRKVDDPLGLAHMVRHLGDAYYYADDGHWPNLATLKPFRSTADMKTDGRLTSRTPFEVSRSLRMRLAQPRRRNFCGRKRTIFI